MLSDKGLQTEKSLSRFEQLPKKSLIEIKEFIDQNYSEPLSNGQLAQMANVNTKYFGDLFKKTFGQSAMNYLTDIRINQAKRYLAKSDVLFRDIAQKVGYSDEFYFSRKFKKEVGMSPSEFTKNSRERLAASTPAIMGQLLALDIVPIAAPLDSKWTPYYYNAYSTLIKSHLKLYHPDANWKPEANLQKLVQARPDAIIGTDEVCPSKKEKLMGIAPSFFVPTENIGWKEQLKMVARFLEREDRAEQWIQRYEFKVQSAREQIGNVLGSDKILVLRIHGPKIHVYWNRGLEDVLYQDLKLKALYRGNKIVNIEQLTELDPDRILLVVCPEASSRAYWLALQHSVEWRQLKAFRSRHIYHILSDPWFEYSADSIIRMLDEALLLFTGNCPNAFLDNVHGNSK